MRTFLHPDLYSGHLCNLVSAESSFQTKRNNGSIVRRMLLHSNCDSNIYASSSNIPRVQAIKRKRRRIELISVELS